MVSLKRKFTNSSSEFFKALTLRINRKRKVFILNNRLLRRDLAVDLFRITPAKSKIACGKGGGGGGGGLELIHHLLPNVFHPIEVRIALVKA